MGMGVVFRSKLEADEERQRGGRTKSNVCLKSGDCVGLALTQLKLC